MALEIFWSKQSEIRFDSILKYLEEEWGEKSVSLFVKKVYDFLDLLSELPEIGTIQNKELKIRGFVIIKQIKIFYQTRNNKIILLNFYDNRQSMKRKKY
jgi:plasmid stabilization system protein ParE